jgi:hypothetical protein
VVQKTQLVLPIHSTSCFDQLLVLQDTAERLHVSEAIPRGKVLQLAFFQAAEGWRIEVGA